MTGGSDTPMIMTVSQKSRGVSLGLRRLRTAICSLAKRLQLRTSSGRRRLTDTPQNTPDHTPQRRCRQILGRTPTKLYSPFGIETPHCGADQFNDSAYCPNTPEHGCSPIRKGYKSKSHVWRLLNHRPRSLFH